MKTWEIINLLANSFSATRYLEIGVERGNTFFPVTMPHKTAVDPAFLFDKSQYEAPGTWFFPETSDAFFASAIHNEPQYKKEEGKNFTFDIIFIDGLHTFEQSYRDFENTLPYSHANTIWILDDTVPCDPYSAIPDMQKSFMYKKRSGLPAISWHGDVYKTVFAIHDFHPEFSYATYVDRDNPQTLLWRAATENRQPFIDSLEAINHLSYFDLLDNPSLLMPMSLKDALSCLGRPLNPLEYKEMCDYTALLHPDSRIVRLIQENAQMREALNSITSLAHNALV